MQATDPTPTDLGGLYVGDFILLPGQDIEAEVLGFEFHDLHTNPDGLAVITDMGRLDGTLSTPVQRLSCNPSPLPDWAITRQWFSSDDDLTDNLSNVGALA
jgi:hypothetical protein